MTGMYAIQMTALAHGELRRALEEKIRQYEAEIEKEYVMSDEAETARMCGDHTGRAQTLEKVVWELGQILTMDERAMYPQREEGEPQ